MTKRINIGLDIGITSIGWALVDEENNIIDRGVRLFKELKDSDGILRNQERRNKRQLRRVIRRRWNRKLDFIKLIANKYSDVFELKSNNFQDKQIEIQSILKNPKLNDVLNIKVKAIKKEVSKHELLKILYNYLAHRGSTYLDIQKYEGRIQNINKINNSNEFKIFANWIETKDHEKDKKEIIDELKKIDRKTKFSRKDAFVDAINSFNVYKKFIETNENITKLPFPSEIQLVKYKENNNCYRGKSGINNEFFIQDWQKEIETVLNNQSYISQEFKNDYLIDKNSIFSRLRDYSEGPGIGSDYGLIKWNDNTKSYEKKYENLWDQLLGYCSVYNDEFRTNKRSISQEVANILNQLNVLKINDSNRENNYLTKNEKKIIIFNSIKDNKIINLKNIVKIINCNINDVFNYPTDIKKTNRESKEVFEELKNSRILFSIFSRNNNISNFDEFMNSKDLFNDIVSVISKNPSNSKKQEKKLIEELQIEQSLAREIVISKIDAKLTSLMSLKALNIYIDEELEDKGLTINRKFKKEIEKNESDYFDNKFNNSKYINETFFDDNEISKSISMSPTTKCSFRETLKVFNAILKKYIYSGKYNIKNIILEMPTELNSADAKKEYDKRKKKHAAKIKQIKEDVEEMGYKFNELDKKTIDKLLLLREQDNKDIYNKDITWTINDIISNHGCCEIDHIIPYSISFDDSKNNKVLTSYKYNKEKGNNTPLKYLGSHKYNILKDELWKKLYLNENNKETYNKKKYGLLTLENMDDKKMMNFIGRNLSDTRYICRLINSYIKFWVKKMLENKILKDDDINIMNINGKTTNRYRWKDFLDIKKDRDIDHTHHAIDASICGILGNSNFTMSKLITYIDHSSGEVHKYNKKDYKLLEILDESQLKNFENNIKWKDIRDNVKNDNINFSYKINKKKSFGFWNDTIYSLKKDNDKNGYTCYEKTKILELNDLKSAAKFIDSLKDIYIDKKTGKTKYPDPKLFDDIIDCFEKGKKLCLEADKLNKENPFKIYMYEFNKIHNILESPTKLALNRDQKIYYVKSLKIPSKKVIDENNFVLTKRKFENKNKAGAYKSLKWQRLHLYFDGNKYKIIPIQAPLLDDHNLNKIDIKKINEKLQANKINKNSKFFIINYGQTLVNKNNKKDIMKIVGFTNNRLEINPIYRKLKPEERDYYRMPINKIIENYSFCDIDMLGNCWIKNLNL